MTPEEALVNKRHNLLKHVADDQIQEYCACMGWDLSNTKRYVHASSPGTLWSALGRLFAYSRVEALPGYSLVCLITTHPPDNPHFRKLMFDSYDSIKVKPQSPDPPEK